MAQPPPAGPPHGPPPGQAAPAPAQGQAPVPDDEAPRRRSGHRRRPGPLARLLGRGVDDRRGQDDVAAPEEQPAAGEEQPASSAHDLLPSALASLALRDLTLVESLLRLVEDMEAREEDPELLESLFRIDHLATRMRRNGENLLVLAGQETDSQRQHPAPLLDVVRAGISEISDYYRADVSSLPEVRVAGLAADDVSHLLAELLDNATSKSPQDQRVAVGGRTLDDGTVVLSVEDNGIGIPAERLAGLNARLSGPPVLDVSVTRHMGLYVVGRLAHRHGMRVHLDSRPFGGTAAYVLVPPWLVQHSPPEEPAGAGHRTSAHTAAGPAAPSAAQGLRGAHSARPANGHTPDRPTSAPAAPDRPTNGHAAHGRPANGHGTQERPANGHGRPADGPSYGHVANGSAPESRPHAPGPAGGGLPRRDGAGRTEPERGDPRRDPPSGVNGDARHEGSDSLGTTLSGLPRRSPGQAVPPPDGAPAPSESGAPAPSGGHAAGPPAAGPPSETPPAGPPPASPPPPGGLAPPGPPPGPDTAPLDRQAPPPPGTDPLGPDTRSPDPLGPGSLDPGSLGADPLGHDPRGADPLGPDRRSTGGYGPPPPAGAPPEGDDAPSANGGPRRSSAAARLLDDLDGFTAGEDAARHQAQEPQDHDGGGQ